MKRKYKILAIDDDLTNIEVIKEIFEKDFDLKVGYSGEDVLGLVNQFNPDILLLDIMMPKIDGFEVCRRVRSSNNHRYLKIILVSAKTLLEDRLRGYAAGADDYITKPFDHMELLAKVKVFLKLKYEEEVNALKSDILMLFSHETKTPLNGILGFADILKEEASLTDNEKFYVNSIIQCGNDLLNFVQKVQLICELKKGIQLTCSPCSIELLLNNIMQQLDSYASESNVSFLRADTIDKQLYLDVKLINTALYYILENAIKFSPSGGSVIIETEICEKNCIIKISDHGEGIKKEKLEKIFDEFSLGKILNHTKGQGLSLALSRYISRAHGGEIIAQNNERGGATFIVSLPLE